MIETASDRDRKRLTGSSTFQVGLRAAEPKRIDPRVVIYDVPYTLTDDVLMCSLHGKNLRGAGGSIDEFKRRAHVVRRWGKDGARVSNVIVQLPLACRDQLLSDGRVYVDWCSFKVSAYERIPQCFACLGYGHDAKDCRSQPLCFRCARPGHVAATCKAPEHCGNCHARKLSSAHSAASRGCPEYARRIQTLRNRINDA